MASRLQFKMKNTKQWLRFSLLNLLVLTSFIVIFNYAMDPLWSFNHKNSLQAHQEGFNERQQKVNLIHFSKSFNYDALILGSSRVTIHNTHLIQSAKTFNLAINGMQPYEFNNYIEYAKQKNQKEFKYIILGLDFTSIDYSAHHHNIQPYIDTSNALLYRYKALLSYDTLKISLKNFRNTAFGKYKKRFKTYNQDYIAFAYSKNPQDVKSAIEESAQKLKNNNINYKRGEYLSVLTQLKKNNPNTHFIVFTTPLPSAHINTLLESSHNREICTQWLFDIIAIFGSVHHFFYLNHVTQNYPETFVDEGHYISDVGNCIDAKIFSQPCIKTYNKNFGILINQNNISKINTMTGLSNAL